MFRPSRSHIINYCHGALITSPIVQAMYTLSFDNGCNTLTNQIAQKEVDKSHIKPMAKLLGQAGASPTFSLYLKVSDFSEYSLIIVPAKITFWR